jgi:hypothetical protein
MRTNENRDLLRAQREQEKGRERRNLYTDDDLRYAAELERTWGFSSPTAKEVAEFPVPGEPAFTGGVTDPAFTENVVREDRSNQPYLDYMNSMIRYEEAEKAQERPTMGRIVEADYPTEDERRTIEYLRKKTEQANEDAAREGRRNPEPKQSPPGT